MYLLPFLLLWQLYKSIRMYQFIKINFSCNSKLLFLRLAAFYVIFCSCSDNSSTDENAALMQKFVKDISLYAKNIKSDFIIIPQNGIELAFNNSEPDDGIMASYVQAIDGIGVEELFYNGKFAVDNESLDMLRKLKSSLPIFVSDFVSGSENLAHAKQMCVNEGFIPFLRSADNYDYKLIPNEIPNVNQNNIEGLNDAKNYLYLISTENYRNKQTMIDAIKSTDYDLILIDLFFDDELFTKSEIQQLKIKNNGGRRLVISYISIGSAENYRYYWQSGWKKGSPSWIKKNYEEYPDEYWVEFWHPEWQKIIFGNNNSYIKKIVDAGFDGAYLDNVEAYYFLVI